MFYTLNAVCTFLMSKLWYFKRVEEKVVFYRYFVQQNYIQSIRLMKSQIFIQISEKLEKKPKSYIISLANN